MTRIRYNALERLRETDSGLFHALLPHCKAEPGGEVVQVHDSAIKGESFKIAFAKFIEQNPAAIVSTTTEQDELWQVTQAQAKFEKDKAHVVKHANEAAARYFQYWAGQRGLIDNQWTQHAIFDEFNKREKRDGAIPSAALLDIVIELLNTQGVIQWRPTEPVIPTPPPPPPPRKIAGSNEDELDINESRPWILKSASDVQQRDLARRQARRDRPELFHFPPLPETITRKVIVNSSPQQIQEWQREYGNDAVDARLQGRG